MLPYLLSASYSTTGAVDIVFGVSLILFFIVLYFLGGFKGIITGKKMVLNWPYYVNNRNCNNRLCICNRLGITTSILKLK